MQDQPDQVSNHSRAGFAGYLHGSQDMCGLKMEEFLMVRCSRFLPALIVSWLYAMVVPVAILTRVGAPGWLLIWNEPAFGFFMVTIFPFTVAVFSCVIRIDLLKQALRNLSLRTLPTIIFCVM